jgi:hypothetical protein
MAPTAVGLASEAALHGSPPVYRRCVFFLCFLCLFAAIQLPSLKLAKEIRDKAAYEG